MKPFLTQFLFTAAKLSTIHATISLYDGLFIRHLVIFMDATHPVFPISPQLVFEWFINRDIKRLEFFSLNRPE
jgi:hypothetical protein